jgi:hypothetical protein
VYKDVLLATIPGKFVVLKGWEIISVEDSYSEAVDESRRILGYGVPFYTKQVLKEEPRRIIFSTWES